MGLTRLEEKAGFLRTVRLAGKEGRCWQVSMASDATKLLREAAQQLEAWLTGQSRSFDLPLSPEGTPFQREVWQALRSIPYGETRSYKDVAAAIGRPRAYRAVGNANNRNPLPIIIPCHRVIGADGSLVGYGGGLWLKSVLLRLEAGCTEKR